MTTTSKIYNDFKNYKKIYENFRTSSGYNASFAKIMILDFYCLNIRWQNGEPDSTVMDPAQGAKTQGRLGTGGEKSLSPVSVWERSSDVVFFVAESVLLGAVVVEAVESWW